MTFAETAEVVFTGRSPVLMSKQQCESTQATTKHIMINKIQFVAMWLCVYRASVEKALRTATKLLYIKPGEY